MKIAHWGTLAALALAANVAGAAEVTAHYSCSDGSRLVATFVTPSNGAASVALQLSGGKTLSLPQAMSADGGRYTDGKTEFWIRGKGATFTRGGGGVTCQADH